MWKIKEASNKLGIIFNTENDDSTNQQRTIYINQDKHAGKASFANDMYSAGGDWEYPLRYFRCELKNSCTKNIQKYSDPHFVFCFVSHRKSSWYLLVLL